MPSETVLKGFTNVGDSLITTQIANNIEQFFNWGLLNKGGYENINQASSGAYGGFFNKLRPVKRQGITTGTSGTIWEGFRGDWVWESGVEYSPAPLRVSGITINNTFFPTSTTGYYAFKINYPLGQVILDNPLGIASSVYCNFSVKWAHFHTVDKADWWQELQTNPDRIDTLYFNRFGSGDRSILSENRVELPAVVVEVIPRSRFKPLQLGGGQFLYQDIRFHIYANTPWERNQLTDIIKYQNDKNILMFNIDSIDSNSAGLSPFGDIMSTTKVYPIWVSATGVGGFNYRNKKLRFMEMTSDVLDRPLMGLWSAEVRTTVEVDMGEL